MAPVNRSEHGAASEADWVDLRAKPRFALLIRCAKLVGRVGEFLCIVRDVSEGGVRLRFFHAPPDIGPAALVLPTGESFAIERVWTQGEQAGFRFVDSIDVHRFIAETGPFPKRPVRLRVSFPAALLVDGQTQAATVLDISRQGARIVTPHPLAIGQQLRIEADGWPGVGATVCWRTMPDHGLVLDRVFSLEELATRAARLQLGVTTEADAPALRRA